MGFFKALFSGFNVKRWLDVDGLKRNGETVGGLYKDVFKNKKNDDEFKGSFKDTMQHFGLSEDDIKKRMRQALYMVYGCLAISLVLFIYMLHLFMHGFVIAGMVCFMLDFLLWSYAFREHFNYFQMKKRKLGCSFKEWVAFLLARGRGN